MSYSMYKSNSILYECEGKYMSEFLITVNDSIFNDAINCVSHDERVQLIQEREGFKRKFKFEKEERIEQ
jgi:hypothetical protein